MLLYATWKDLVLCVTPEDVIEVSPEVEGWKFEAGDIAGRQWCSGRPAHGHGEGVEFHKDWDRFFGDCVCADRFVGSRIFVAAWVCCRSK